MPKPPALATYITYEAFTGTPCTLDELTSYLSRFRRTEVLFACALLNTFLETWSGKIRRDVHDGLLSMAFLPDHANRLKAMTSTLTETVFVFHRLQILFVAKQAVMNCRDDGDLVDPSQYPYWGGLGIAFLMANDLLHSEFDPIQRTLPHSLIRMAHSIPTLESSGRPAFTYKTGRAWLMLKQFGPSSDTKSYIDIEGVFQAATGLSTDDYLSLCVGTVSHYLSLDFERLRKKEDSIVITKEWFTSAGVSPMTVDRFLEDVSALPETFAARFRSKDGGPSDMTWFRDKPVCKLREDAVFALDTKCLTEKLDSGIFWRVHTHLKSAREKDSLHNCWGIAFENYLNWLLRQACKNSRNIFYPSPRYEKTGEEVCDAIVVCGADAIFLEYKGSTFTATSKYKGDLEALAAEIEENLIGTESKRKGIRQLSHAILGIFDKKTPVVVAGVDFSQVKSVYPVLIIRDEVGGCFGISHYLNGKAEGFFYRRKVRPRIVTPIFCLSSEGIETISAYLQNDTLSHLLEGWYREDPGLHWSFSSVENSVTHSHGYKTNSDLDKAFDQIFQNARQILFPDSKHTNLS